MYLLSIWLIVHELHSVEGISVDFAHTVGVFGIVCAGDEVPFRREMMALGRG